MGQDALAGKIRAKIAAGRLPHPPDPPERVWAGRGDGRICDGCDQPITRTQIEYEVDPPGGQTIRTRIEYEFDPPGSQTIRFHGPCLMAWYAQRAPGTP
jgi:hypothetical protein